LDIPAEHINQLQLFPERGNPTTTQRAPSSACMTV
jgi:hypothetical protein